MYHLATELAHPPQRHFEVLNLEVRQRMRITGSLAPFMHAEDRGAARRLPAFALVTGPVNELDVQHCGPEASGTIRIVGRELDEM